MSAMKSTKIAGLVTALFLMQACGGGSAPAGPPGAQAGAPDAAADKAAEAPAGLITAADLNLGDIDAAMAEKGKTTYDVKCQACHSTGENRVVGPGWKGVTTKREPAWIMNMIMNIDVMLEKDPEAQKLLEECLVRMPNQNLSKDEAREVLEFMRTL
jgi:cytochrome c5